VSKVTVISQQDYNGCTVAAADGHVTTQHEVPRFEQIITHHNAPLAGFDVGSHKVRVTAASTIQL